MFQNFIKERNQGYSRECKDCEKERKKIKRATQEINDRDRFLSRKLKQYSFWFNKRAINRIVWKTKWKVCII